MNPMHIKEQDHEFILYAHERYRDESRNETVLEIYRCICGEGKAIPLGSTLIDSESYEQRGREEQS